MELNNMLYLKNILFKISFAILFSIIALLITNNALFLHSHYLIDGTVITHAHPFKKSADSGPYRSHNHTNAELILLENLQLLFYIVSIPFIASSFLKDSFVDSSKRWLLPESLIIPHQGRAPPSLL